MPPILTQVQPGDLITAADWNTLVDAINSAFARIEALEAGAQAGIGLAITQLVPAGPYRIGDALQILGRNFQFSIGAARVFLNATQVLNLLPTSTDSRLEFVIPAVPGVVEAGTPVDMVVLNQTESVSQQITLRPRQTPLQGNVTVEYLSVTPTTVTAGQPATFNYRIQSGTNNRATWSINPQVSVATNAAAWNAQLRVLDASGSEIASRQIDLDPGQQRNFSIQIATVPAGTSGVQFGLSVNVSANGITGSSGIRQFTVGTADVPPDSTITLALQPALSFGALVGSTLTVPGGQSRDLAIAAQFTVSGTYNITRTVLGTATGWTVTPISGTPNSYTISNQDLAATGRAERLMRFSVAAAATATANAELEIRVQRTGQTAFRSVVVDLVRS
jgi:hypothetical protein